MGIKYIEILENDGVHICVGLRAKAANIENNMAVIDAGGVKRRFSRATTSLLEIMDGVQCRFWAAARVG